MYSAYDHLAVGLPHSEIHGSKSARLSPRLFAACYVLHRLLVPRHPPNALQRLISTFPSEPLSHLQAGKRTALSLRPRKPRQPSRTCAHPSIPRSCDRESAERAILLQTLRRFASKPDPRRLASRFTASIHSKRQVPSSLVKQQPARTTSSRPRPRPDACPFRSVVTRPSTQQRAGGGGRD